MFCGIQPTPGLSRRKKTCQAAIGADHDVKFCRADKSAEARQIIGGMTATRAGLRDIKVFLSALRTWFYVCHNPTPMWSRTRTGFRRARTRRIFQWGDRDDSARAKSRGSPFQLPARLAVGLGLESGLETGCPVSFAPSSTPRNLGLPRPASGRKPDFGCNAET